MQRIPTIFFSVGRVASLFNLVLKKDQPATFIPFNSDELHVMKTLKNVLISPPIPALYYFGAHMTPETDVCNVQIGGV